MIFLPYYMHCFLRYLVLRFNLTLEIVLKSKHNAYHVCVSARVRYALFAYVINLVVFG